MRGVHEKSAGVEKVQALKNKKLRNPEL